MVRRRAVFFFFFSSVFFFFSSSALESALQHVLFDPVPESLCPPVLLPLPPSSRALARARAALVAALREYQALLKQHYRQIGEPHTYHTYTVCVPACLRVRLHARVGVSACMWVPTRRAVPPVLATSTRRERVTPGGLAAGGGAADGAGRKSTGRPTRGSRGQPPVEGQEPCYAWLSSLLCCGLVLMLGGVEHLNRIYGPDNV